MDSKGKKLGILIVLCVVLIVMMAIMLANFNQLIAKDKKGEDVVAEYAQKKIESDGKIEGADLSAFLRDDEFFDSEPVNTSNLNQITGEVNRDGEAVQVLTVLASSVERDIRVKILDDKGEAVTGQDFMVEVANTGAYIDEDKDGIVHISDLKPGDYEVAVRERAGFKVPTEPVTVKVKSIVSYTAIDDIEYFVHSESEIDILKDDTKVEIGAVDEEDEDDTQYKSLLDIDEEKNTIELGIDVSKWNGEIDWDVVKAEGVDFAIIRCGYRGSSSGWLVEDPYFYKNLEGARKAGVKVGVYFFTQATTLVEAVEEASMVVTLIDACKLDYPVFIDTEGAGGNGRADNLDADTRTAVVNAFCQTIQNSGLDAGIYASRNWYLNNLNTDEFYDVAIWLAEYRETPLYEDEYDMWQYTSSGSVAGIEGRVDLNVSYIGNGN